MPNQYSNVYPFKAKSKELNQGLDHFNQWLAAKLQMQNLLKNTFFMTLSNNKINPKIDPSLKLTHKPFDLGFFKPNPANRLLPEGPKPNHSLSNEKKELEEKQKDLKFSLGCNNCGETGHNSKSCPTPSASPKP